MDHTHGEREREREREWVRHIDTSRSRDQLPIEINGEINREASLILAKSLSLSLFLSFSYSSSSLSLSLSLALSSKKSKKKERTKRNGQKYQPNMRHTKRTPKKIPCVPNVSPLFILPSSSSPSSPLPITLSVSLCVFSSYYVCLILAWSKQEIHY